MIGASSKGSVVLKQGWDEVMTTWLYKGYYYMDSGTLCKTAVREQILFANEWLHSAFIYVAVL